MKRIIFILALVVLVLLFVNFYHSEKSESKSLPNDLIVHEWGTFTSIAGKDGVAIDWRPLNGPTDLPKFVYTVDSKKGYRGTYNNSGGKGALARVRMETPVIYFYTKKEMEVNVSVMFEKGKITEWYPQASFVNSNFSPGETGLTFNNTINWGTIKLLPNEKPNYLREVSYSHYYPARETDSVPVQICNADKTKIETEKFLFYRGVGNFNLPLSVKLNNGKIAISDEGLYPVKNLIVFENLGGKIGFRLVEPGTGETIIERPETNKTIDDVLDELKKILITSGLYEKEAKAMIATWKDSWFEEGLRVFYVLPTESTGKILSLDIDPQPKETVRVLVGRTEIITPEMEQDVKKQAALLNSPSEKNRQAAEQNLRQRGRFYEPILKSILQTEKDENVRAELQKLISVGD